MKKIKVFKGGTLFDGTGGNLIKDAVVAVSYTHLTLPTSITV